MPNGRGTEGGRPAAFSQHFPKFKDAVQLEAGKPVPLAPESDLDIFTECDFPELLRRHSGELARKAIGVAFIHGRTEGGLGLDGHHPAAALAYIPGVTALHSERRGDVQLVLHRGQSSRFPLRGGDRIL